MIEQFQRNEKFVEDDGRLKTRSFELMRQLAQLGILTGSGSPETVIEAKVTTLYMDTSGTAGNILYIKRDEDIAGNRTRGWILV